MPEPKPTDGSELPSAADHDPTTEPADENEDTSGTEDADEVELQSGIPEEYAELLGERTLLWYESRAEYDDFERAVFLELRPKGIVESILIRDFVEYEWEVRRLRRVKAAAVYRELAIFASDELAETKGGLLNRVHSQTQMRHYVRGSAMGVSDAKKLLKERAEGLLLRPVDLHCAAHIQALPVLDAINRELARAELRRDQLLRQLEDRRMTLATMARCLVVRGEAETIEANVEAA